MLNQRVVFALTFLTAMTGSARTAMAGSEGKFISVAEPIKGMIVAAPITLLGTWSGLVHHETEDKAISLRFERENDAIVMFFSLPDLKFHNVGPIPISQQGDEYTAAAIRFQLAGDNLVGHWSFDGHDLPFELRAGALAAESDGAPLTGRVAQPVWTLKTGAAIWSSPAGAEDTVYFGSDDQFIYAVKARSGQLAWRFKTGGRVIGSPTVHGPYLYVLSDDGYLYKIQRHHAKLIWQFDTHGGSVARDLPGSGSTSYDSLTSGATVADGTVYIGSADKRLYAIDSETGHEKWHFETQDIVRSTPAAAHGRVFVGSREHSVYAVNAGTGALVWKYDTLREVVSSPLILDGTVYVGSRSSDFFAFDAATGAIKWKYFYWSSWVESSAHARDGILYVGSSDAQQVFAIDATTGKRIWSFDTDGSAWSTPAVTNQHVYVGAVGVLHYMIEHHGGFFAVDRATGKVAWRYPMAVLPQSSTYGVASSPLVHRGLVFFGGLDGMFYAFRAD